MFVCLLQKQALRIINFAPFNAHTSPLLNTRLVYQVITLSDSEENQLSTRVSQINYAPHPTIFFKTPPLPSKPMPPMGCTPPLKDEAPPYEKHPPSPLMKPKAPANEMIPRKSTINNNLKSS